VDLAARRQIYVEPDRVNILNPYRHAGGGGGYLLDTYPGAEAAYSLRKLRNDQTYAIRVRRSSDSSEQDIGFDGSGNLDTSAISAFCGSGSGYVKTWYDQSGNGFDMSQATASKQPVIMNAGTLFSVNSLPALDSEGTRWLYSSAGTLSSTGDSAFSHIVVGAHQEVGVASGISSLVPASFLQDRRTIRSPANDSSSLLSSRLYGGNCLWTGTINGLSQFIFEEYYPGGGGSWDGYLDGTLKSVSQYNNSGLNLQSSSGFDCFNAVDNALGIEGNIVDGHLQEVIWWMSNKSSNRSSIYANVSDYWA
jgi:hypothetical protein